MTPMIQLTNVLKRYPPEVDALSSIDLKVQDGEFVFVAGASGAGKSTLLKLLFGAERASSGQVIVGGRNLMSIKGDAIAMFRRDIGVVFQDYKLLPKRSVLDNVTFTLEVQGVRPRERLARATTVLEVMGLKDKLHSSPLALSGGEQQRVALARAIIHRPRLLLADEPTGNLDPDMTQRIFEIIIESNKQGTTVLVASHNLGLIEDMKKRTVVLDKGKIIGDFGGN